MQAIVNITSGAWCLSRMLCKAAAPDERQQEERRSLDKGRDTQSVIPRRLFGHCCSGRHKRTASVSKGNPGQGRDRLRQHPALPELLLAAVRCCHPPGFFNNWGVVFPMDFHSPSLVGSSRKDKSSLPGDFMSLARAVGAATSQSPGWNLAFLSAQMIPVLLFCIRGLMVKPFVLTLSFYFCLFAAPQLPASAFNPPGTCLIFSCGHQREKQRMQNTANRDILMRGESTAIHECSFKVTKS